MERPPSRTATQPHREEEDDDADKEKYDGGNEGEPPDGDPDGQDNPPKHHPRSQFPHTWRDWLLAIFLMIVVSEFLHLICPTDVKRNRRRLIHFGRTIMATTGRLFERWGNHARMVVTTVALSGRLRMASILRATNRPMHLIAIVKAMALRPHLTKYLDAAMGLLDGPPVSVAVSVLPPGWEHLPKLKSSVTKSSASAIPT
ncbi:hypothetical protein DXG03_005537 [Asterophora parasitica]|uniref:Uncharacterized protein n=1 Tax=Asterophora parasitica TaxID=117018 RepID=A0A9P7G1M1_9AGAR|nr:hypothetical protein DXG03_005537 [Asterophora parasitica]